MSMQPDLVVSAGDVSFFGSLPFSGSGFVIDPDGFEGFDDGVSARSGGDARSGAHGDFEVPTFLESRIVNISGSCLADSPQELAQFRAVFAGLFASGSLPVLFEHLGRRVSAVGSRAPGTAPKFKVNGAGAVDARFQLQIKFPNPRLFGNVNTVGPAASVSAFHYGNFAASSQIRVVGDFPTGYTISGPGGRQFIVNQPLSAGHVHDIDMASGLFRHDEVALFGVVSRADTWSVPGGGFASFVLTGNGTGVGVMTVKTPDTFV